MNDLPSLESVFGHHYPRLQGIKHWEDVTVIGSANLARLEQLAQENVIKQISESSSRDEVKAIRSAIRYISETLLPTALNKPLFPRLRAESFRAGDVVRIYLGDTATVIAGENWLKAVITEVAKSYRGEWMDGTPNSGYYWRLTATATGAIFNNEKSISFSTSEPRVLLETDFDYLKRAIREDEKFLQIFSENAKRDWPPLWSLERSIVCDTKSMDLKRWIIEG